MMDEEKRKELEKLSGLSEDFLLRAIEIFELTEEELLQIVSDPLYTKEDMILAVESSENFAQSTDKMVQELKSQVTALFPGEGTVVELREQLSLIDGSKKEAIQEHINRIHLFVHSLDRFELEYAEKTPGELKNLFERAQSKRVTKKALLGKTEEFIALCATFRNKSYDAIYLAEKTILELSIPEEEKFYFLQKMLEERAYALQKFSHSLEEYIKKSHQ